MGVNEDERFAHVATDPKFRRIPKTERKVKIDKRFQSMFKDKKFKVKYTVDKRGRPVNHTSKEDLKRYYELSSEDDSSVEESETGDLNESGKYVRASKVDEAEKEDDEIKTSCKDDKKVSDVVRKRLKNLNVDYARGEGNLGSESSSDDEESELEVSESEDIDHKWGELDADAERTDEATYRLAACNMDWDRIRATDLMILFNSFVSSGGLIQSVIIYPSEYGLQRMKEEEIKGPIELVETKADEEEENEEGSKYHMEKLRQYQLNRLKYYYAVITCDNANTANKIYSECDGMEYESSATKIDLRFIPNDMEFTEEPKEICDKLPDLTKYKPRFFTTTALQQAKVDLTWDETNPERLEIAEKLASGKLDEVNEEHLRHYLASSSEEESEAENEATENIDEADGKNPIDKYRALLQEIENNEKEREEDDVEMELTWGVDLKEKTDELIKKKITENESKTPFQQHLDKMKEKRKQKKEQRKKTKQENEDSDVPSDIDMNDPYFAEEFNKPEFKNKKKVPEEKPESEDPQNKAELELLLFNEDEDSKKHFSLKKIQENENESKSKKKRKMKRKATKPEESVDNFDLNVKDERFSALYSSHHFNIDPTDPHYKKTKGMEKLVEEKLKRRNDCDLEAKKPKLENKKKAELSVLVKSVKRKAESFKKTK